MMDKIKKAMEEFNLREFFGGKTINQEIAKAFDEGIREGLVDTRYNEPKESPKASDELVNETIENTEIYKRVKELILNAQKDQVAYGLDKYPEPLNADTWSILETIDHIMDESIDRLHYLMMLRIKLEKDAEKTKDRPKREGLIYVDNNIPVRSVNDCREKLGMEPIKDHATEYCKADVEATAKMFSALGQCGEDSDGDKKHIKQMVRRENPCNKKQVIEVKIDLNGTDGFDALVYAINSELENMNRRGLL